MNTSSRIAVVFCVVACVMLSLPSAASAQRRRQTGPQELTQAVYLTAAEAFEKGMGSTTVQHDFASGGVVLYDTMLVEDDGQGAGGNPRWTDEAERSPDVPVDAENQLKKVLVVDRPGALEAVLYVRPGRATLLFNGQEIERSGSDKFFKVPPELVKKGDNEVVIRAEGDVTAGVKLALRRHIEESYPSLKGRPPRSFKSTDGGRSWEPLDGELVCRLHLTQYPAEGSFTSPVIDLGRTDRDPLGLVPVVVHGVTLSHEADTPEGTRVGFAIRHGMTPVCDESWTDWRAPDTPPPECMRYVQWQATLKTDDSKVTPVLKSVRLEAKVTRDVAPQWAGGTRLSSYHNERILYTSMPFEYEDPAHPRMKLLREKYKLEEIVAPGKTELERIVLLRDWVSRQWRFKGPGGHYPAWDADEIMTRKTGMCVQYAITLVQCASALGWPGRYVCGYHQGTMGTAHEVSEIWSNEHRKWVFMDPTTSRNEFAIDPKTGVPLSMNEIHERMVRHYYGDKPAEYKNRPAKFGRWSDDIALVRGPTVEPNMSLDSADPLPRDWPSWTKWFLLCYVPRNNWYARPHPLPRLQGWNNWDWTDFWSWYDAQTPRDLRYGRFASRRADVEWTINQTAFGAAWGREPDTVDVQLGTVTPNFDTFLVSADGGEWKPSGPALAWPLHAGANRLEMRVRNTSGVLGPVSFITLHRPE